MRIYKKGDKVVTAEGKTVTIAKATAMPHPVTPGRQVVVYEVAGPKGKPVLLTEQQVRNLPKK